MFEGTKYATCFPIGTMEVVMNFKPQTLRDYYEKWYRPDLQGIVVVGDIDGTPSKPKSRKMFSDIPAQPNAAKREYYPVNDNKGAYCIGLSGQGTVQCTSPHLQQAHEATP